MLEKTDIRQQLALLSAGAPGIERETIQAWVEELYLRGQDIELEDLSTARSRVLEQPGRPTLAALLAHARERATRRRAMTPRIEGPSSGIRGELAARAVLEMLARPRHERPQSEAEWERAIRARCEGGMA